MRPVFLDSRKVKHVSWNKKSYLTSVIQWLCHWTAFVNVRSLPCASTIATGSSVNSGSSFICLPLLAPASTAMNIHLNFNECVVFSNKGATCCTWFAYWFICWLRMAPLPHFLSMIHMKTGNEVKTLTPILDSPHTHTPRVLSSQNHVCEGNLYIKRLKITTVNSDKQDIHVNIYIPSSRYPNYSFFYK
jgi:hypothetical protein